jgi:hypothetical protein
MRGKRHMFHADACSPQRPQWKARDARLFVIATMRFVDLMPPTG